MPLEDSSTVDAIGVDKATGEAILSIFDGWDWSDEQEHLVALQDKINAYLRFIESGEIWTSYPAAVNRRLVIEIVSRLPLPENGQKFVGSASEIANEIDVTLRQRVA